MLLQDVTLEWCELHLAKFYIIIMFQTFYRVTGVSELKTSVYFNTVEPVLYGTPTLQQCCDRQVTVYMKYQLAVMDSRIFLKKILDPPLGLVILGAFPCQGCPMQFYISCEQAEHSEIVFS